MDKMLENTLTIFSVDFISTVINRFTRYFGGSDGSRVTLAMFLTRRVRLPRPPPKFDARYIINWQMARLIISADGWVRLPPALPN